VPQTLGVSCTPQAALLALLVDGRVQESQIVIPGRSQKHLIVFCSRKTKSPIF
jgi:hypothetical protein